MPLRSRGVELKSPDELRQMRRAGLVVARTLAAVAAEAHPGTTTAELDRVAADVIRSAGALPSFLDYGAVDGVGGFTGVTCLSVGSEVVHGMPGDRVLARGELLSIDCGAIVDGWHGDAALSVVVGEPDPATAAPELHALNEATCAALWQGIAAARLGGHVRDISVAVEAFVRAQPATYGIVEDYVGHGIGSAMHEEPDVPNQVSRRLLPGRGPRLVEGMALAIEPMLTLGHPDTHVLDDDWTVVTDDASPASHWEHTITVTPGGVWVLTAVDGGEEMLASLGVPYGPLS